MEQAKSRGASEQGAPVRITPHGEEEASGARRAYTRFDVELEVNLESDSNFYMGLTENLSEGGLFISTVYVKPLGTEVDLAFRLPGGEAPIRATGVVRWLREFSDNAETPAGMGIRFQKIAESDVARIRGFLAARPPLFFDE